MAVIESINGQRVLFGIKISDTIVNELERIGSNRALVLSTPEQSDMAASLAKTIGKGAVGTFTQATMHTPVNVTVEAIAYAKSIGADAVVSVGGGSTIGLGKAIVFNTGLPHIAVPTTYAGSEATPILGQTENGVKTTQSDPKILPNVILYDPELTASLPTAMTVTSALNAIAHAAEGLYAKERTAQLTELGLKGIRAFVDGLPGVLENPFDLKSREQTQYGAWACGTVLGMVGMALHHKLCHTLGGTLNLSHADTHAIILPHAIAYNEVAVPELLAPLAEILNSKSPSQGLWEFANQMGAPLALSDLGVKEGDIEKVVSIASKNPYWNPREITEQGLRVLLLDAMNGKLSGNV